MPVSSKDETKEFRQIGPFLSDVQQVVTDAVRIGFPSVDDSMVGDIALGAMIQSVNDTIQLKEGPDGKIYTLKDSKESPESVLEVGNTGRAAVEFVVPMKVSAHSMASLLATKFGSKIDSLDMEIHLVDGKNYPGLQDMEVQKMIIPADRLLVSRRRQGIAQKL